MKIMSEREIIS